MLSQLPLASHRMRSRGTTARAGWPPRHGQFDAERSPRGAMVFGTPQEVIDKILFEHELFGMTRFLIQFTVGTLPHDVVMRSIELFGTVVAPEVRRVVAERSARGVVGKA